MDELELNNSTDKKGPSDHKLPLTRKEVAKRPRSLSPQSSQIHPKKPYHQYNDPITSPYGNSSNVNLRYKKECRIGQGTYGVVYKAKDTITNETVAIKRCLPHHEEKDGFPITTLREIQILKEIQGHENIVELKEVAVSSKQSDVFLVFEFAHFDLANLIDDYYAKYNRGPFTAPETKCLSKQLLSAVNFLHQRYIIHRDLKLSNLLYNKEKGLLKLCDFGLARRMSRVTKSANRQGKTRTESRLIPTTPPQENLTPKVVSLWYRPPELLLNSDFYDFTIDSWAVGCIVAEILLGVPLFKGTSEINQLQTIVELLGPPNAQSWPELTDMPLFKKDGNSELSFITKTNAKGRGRSNFFDKFSHLSTEGIRLLSSLLAYDPKKRWSAEKALESKWLIEFPIPTRKENMPKFPWKAS